MPEWLSFISVTPVMEAMEAVDCGFPGYLLPLWRPQSRRLHVCYPMGVRPIPRCSRGWSGESAAAASTILRLRPITTPNRLGVGPFSPWQGGGQTRYWAKGEQNTAMIVCSYHPDPSSRQQFCFPFLRCVVTSLAGVV